MNETSRFSVACQSSSTGEHIPDPTRVRVGQPLVALNEAGTAVVVTLLCAACEQEGTAVVFLKALKWTPPT